MKDETLEAVGIVSRKLQKARGSLAMGYRDRDRADQKIAFHMSLVDELEAQLAQLRAQLEQEITTPE